MQKKILVVGFSDLYKNIGHCFYKPLNCTMDYFDIASNTNLLDIIITGEFKNISEKNSISIYAFVLILCMFTMYTCCISFVFLE